MRIMHVMRSDRFAGVEQFVLRLAVTQASLGNRVHVAGGVGARMHDALSAAGATWEPLSSLHDLPRVLRRHGFGADVVNTHMTDADVTAALLLPRRGPAFVSTRHFARERRHVGLVRTDAVVRRRVDAEIAISNAVAVAIRAPSTVVHSGVPAGSPSHGGRSQRVLMVQRFQPEKRTQVGIDAFIRSRLAGEGWTLDVAGDGPLRAEAQRVIDRSGVSDAVRLLGFRDDVPALLDASAILLAPCPGEGLGLAVLEAMASGVAPLVADAAGHRDLVEGLDPIARFAADDTDGAASALRTLASDDARRSALAAAARDRARREFSLERQAEETGRVYRAAMARRRR